MAVLTYHKNTSSSVDEATRRLKYVIRKETHGDNPHRPWTVRRFNTVMDRWMRSGCFPTFAEAVEHTKKLIRLNRATRRGA